MYNTEQTFPEGAPTDSIPPPVIQPLRRSLSLSAWTSASLASLLVLSELLVVEFGVVWALGGPLKIASELIWIVAATGAVGCIWLSMAFFKVALRNELAISQSSDTASHL